MSRAFRQAQAESLAGRHEAAVKLFAAARRAAPNLPHLAVQEALAEARAGRPESGLRLLQQSGEQSPAARLVTGFLLARVGRLEPARTALRTLYDERPANRVVATALAYTLLRADQPRPALELLADPGDNLELLSWAWTALEAQAPRLRPTAPAPLPAPADPPRAGRRLFAAGRAAQAGHLQARVRQTLGAARWAKPLHGLLGALDRRWPTDPLTAYRRAAATGAELPGLALHLGAAWQESGHPREALDALLAARAELEAAWAPRLAKVPEADRAAAQAELDSGEDACLARLYRAAALADLERWAEAEALLDELATLADEGESERGTSGKVHEFALPEWYLLRGRCRLAAGRTDAAQADIQRALEGDPMLFAARRTRLAARF